MHFEGNIQSKSNRLTIHITELPVGTNKIPLCFRNERMWIFGQVNLQNLNAMLLCSERLYPWGVGATDEFNRKYTLTYN